MFDYNGEFLLYVMIKSTIEKFYSGAQKGTYSSFLIANQYMTFHIMQCLSYCNELWRERELMTHEFNFILRLKETLQH